MMGIYAYFDKKDNSVVYVGKDSYIDKGKRKRDHMLPSTYNHQRFNRVLQNNPSRYEYKEIFVFDEISNTELNHLEMQQIALFNPKFNFTKGGDGFKGGKQSEESRRKISENNARYWQGKTFSEEHRKNLSKARKGEKRRPLSEETKRKIGEANRGKIRTEETRRKLSEAHKGYTPSLETRRKMSEAWKGENHPYYGKPLPLEIRKKISETLKGRKLPLETRKKISEAQKGKPVSDETRKKLSENNARYWKGKTFSQEHWEKLIKGCNTSGIYRVSKHKNKRFKQGFIWTYIYFEDGKRKELASVYLKKLEERVKAKGLEWYKLDEVLE